MLCMEILSLITLMRDLETLYFSLPFKKAKQHKMENILFQITLILLKQCHAHYNPKYQNTQGHKITRSSFKELQKSMGDFLWIL